MNLIKTILDKWSMGVCALTKESPTGTSCFFRELSKAGAFIRKDIKITVSYKLNFIFQFIQIFFSIAVIYFIGKMLQGAGRTSTLYEYGSDYFSFALIGLAVNSYLKAGLVTIPNDIRQTMDQGTLEAMCAAPINYTWLILCASLWQFVFETIRIIAYLVTAVLIFGLKLPNANWAGAIVTLVLSAPVFLMLGIISCSILIVVKKGDPINWGFAGLGSLLAGTMYPVSVMPSWLQGIAFYLPLTHSLEAMRRCLLTKGGFYQVSGNLWVLIGFIIILTPLTILINKVCMAHAKREGAFSTY